MADDKLCGTLNLTDSTRCSFQDFLKGSTPATGLVVNSDDLDHGDQPSRIDLMAIGLHLCQGSESDKIQCIYDMVVTDVEEENGRSDIG